MTIVLTVSADRDRRLQIQIFIVHLKIVKELAFDLPHNVRNMK